MAGAEVQTWPWGGEGKRGVTAVERSVRTIYVVGSTTMLSLWLAACAGGMLGSGAPPTYDLTAPHVAHAGSKSRGQLVVSEPTALSVLDSDRIVVRSAGDQVAHLANAQWSDRLPKLLQTRIVQAFEDASRLRAVGTPDERVSADYQLVTDVRAFEISVVSAPMAQVEISAKVVSDHGGRIVAARVFRASIPAHSSEGQDAAVALDEAFHQVTNDLVLWASKLV